MLAECEYRGTHHYCPHPEHACTCLPADAPPPALTGEEIRNMRLTMDIMREDGLVHTSVPQFRALCDLALAGLEDARRLEDARWALLTIMSTPLDDSAPPAEAGESAAADHYRQAAYAMARAASGALDAASQPGTGEAQDAD